MNYNCYRLCHPWRRRYSKRGLVEQSLQPDKPFGIILATFIVGKIVGLTGVARITPSPRSGPGLPVKQMFYGRAARARPNLQRNRAVLARLG